MNIIFVTSNKGKFATALKYINGNINLINEAYDIKEPSLNDIEYIAKFKATMAYKKFKKPCIVLDAGFFIPYFPGQPNFPGAFVRRNLIEKLGIDGLLKKMENVKNRECYFKECLVYYDGKTLKSFFGYLNGSLAKEIKGRSSDVKWSDLWYVFIPQNNTKTIAQMNAEERNHNNDGYINPFKSFNEWFERRNENNE